jgi:hypothetical protein
MQVLGGMQHGAIEIDNDTAYAVQHLVFGHSGQAQTFASSLRMASITAL